MDKFERKLSDKILSDFSNAKEWSDLISILKDLQNLIKKYENTNIGLSNVKDRINLSKRLAQCLNPVLPSGLHKETIDTYNQILNIILKENNNCLCDNLGLYASGLFPFFQNASAGNKILFIGKIVEEIFLKLDKTELELCLPGFLAGILPGLEEQNEDLKTRIKLSFKEIKIKVTDEIFFGSLWSIIIRNQRLRLTGMRYLSETIPPFKTYIQLPDEKSKESYVSNYYPKLDTLVINTLCAVIEDTEVQTVRAGMDFIKTRFPLETENTLLTKEQKKKILISALNLLDKNEYSTTRRLSQWLLGQNSGEEDIDFSNPETVNMFELLVSAFKDIFKESEFTCERIQKNIKILNQLLNQQVFLIDKILEKISFDVANSVVNYWVYNLNQSEFAENDEAIKKVKMFFNRDPTFSDNLWKSLGEHIADYIQSENVSNDEMLNKLTNRLKFCLLYINLYSNENKIDYFSPIIANLLNIITSIEIERDELKKSTNIILLTLVFTKSIQQEETENQKEKEKEKIIKVQSIRKTLSLTMLQGMTEKISNISEIQEKFKIDIAGTIEHILSQKKYAEKMRHLTKSVLAYQDYYVKMAKELLNYQNFTIGELKMFKQATELLIRIEEYAQQSQVPEWVLYLEKLTFEGNTQISLEASSFLIDMLILNMKNPIYKVISEHLINTEINEMCIKENYLNQLINSTSGNKSCAELLMSRLWMLLDEQQYQQGVMDLLVKFSKANIEIFIKIISNTFSKTDYEMNVKAIKKFSEFWKLTNELYPDVTLFEKGQCIFKMLEFLDHTNPMVRHLSKSWLNQSVLANFNKILDPLLCELFSEDGSWNLKDKKFIFVKEYDNRRIMAAFQMLKNIIINTKESGVNYLEKLVSSQLLGFDSFGKEIEKQMPKFIQRKNYLQLMVNISLRFIQGTLHPDISNDFIKENYSVRAASCEFLEYLLGFIDNKKTLMQITIYITEPILELLNRSLEEKDEVMEVQVLNLLRVLLINTKSEHKNYKEINDLFKHPLLINGIVQGIQIKYFFVRGHFISFAESILPLFNDVLTQKDITAIALKLITTSSFFLMDRVSFSLKGKNESQHFSHFDVNHCDFIFKNYLEEYAEYKTFDENDVLSILRGFREILFHFLKIKKPYETEKDNWIEIKKNLQKSIKDPMTIGEFFNGLFSSGGYDDESKNELRPIVNLEAQLQNIISSLLTVWINESEEYVPYDYCLNDNGILSYKEKEDILVDKIDIGKESDIKPLILEILLTIFKQDPIRCMSHFLKVWCNTPREGNSAFDKKVKDKQYKLSLLEVMISMKIPLQIILISLRGVLQLAPKEKYKKGKSKKFLCKYEQSVMDAKVCHLIYSYILLNNFVPRGKEQGKSKGKRTFDSDNVNDIWNEMVNILEIYYDNSKLSYTFCWLIEIINLMLIKIPLTNANESVKKNLSYYYSGLNRKLMDIAFSEKFESIYETNEYLTLPVLPSIYTNVVNEKFKSVDLYQKTIDTNSNRSRKKTRMHSKTVASKDSIKSFDGDDSIINTFKEAKTFETERQGDLIGDGDIMGVQFGKVNDFYLRYYDTVINKKKLSKDALQEYYRKLAFLTLKNTFSTSVRNLFSDSLNDIIKLYSNLIENLISTMKSELMIKNKNFYSELATEFLQTLMLKESMYTVKGGKSLIMEYFLNQSFFITNPKMIRFWKEIINGLSKHYSGDIISDLINSIDSGFLFFKGSDTSNSRTLRRMSFVIYSCEKDHFSSKLNVIKEKVKELITTYNDSSILEEEIFLMMRVLFLRFSHDNVMEMIKMLWPLIFSELVSIIEKKKKNDSVLLTLESFKFIELLSLANIEEFSLYQWIFIVDTFDLKRLDTTDINSLMTSLLDNEGKVFKPVAMNVTKKWARGKENLVGKKKGKTDLVIVRTNKEQNNNKDKMDYNELVHLVKKFFYSIGDMNCYKVSVNYRQIEEIIESDFLI